MIIPGSIRPSFVATLTTFLLLAGCSQDTQTGTPAGPSEPPADAPTALVYGMTNSTIYEALTSKVKMTVSGGNQKVTDFDLVIVDGDGFSGQQLSGDGLVREAIHSGVWVLSLDASEGDKAGLGKMLHGSSQGDVDAYLIRQETQSDGSLVGRLIDFANPDYDPDYVAAEVATYVKEKRVETQQTVPGDLPSRAVAYYLHYLSDYSGPLPQTNNPVFNGKSRVNGSFLGQADNPQNMSWKVDHQISLFLDALNNPQGDFQHMLVDLKGLANPGALAINNVDDASDNYGMSELAWIQTRFDASTVVSSNSGLELIETTPTTANSVSTVTSGGYSFGLGVNQEGGGVTFNYTSPQTTTTIDDWQVQDTSGKGAQWSYASNTLYDGMNTNGFDAGAWFYYFQGVTPKDPNNLSVNTLEYETESYWKNNNVVSDQITVSGTDNVWYTDAWAVIERHDDNPDGNNPHCVLGCENIDPTDLIQHMARYNYSRPWGLTVDMAAVIPVETASLEFSPNPVTAGQTAVATLRLKSPTPVPADILVKSLTSGVTPENNSYIIPANEDTLTFNVLTGAEGCQPQSATIQARYADGQNAVLTVDPPANCP